MRGDGIIRRAHPEREAVAYEGKDDAKPAALSLSGGWSPRDMHASVLLWPIGLVEV